MRKPGATHIAKKKFFDMDPIRDYVSYVVYSGLDDALRHGN